VAVPGAFTPTCSARHIPGFLDRLEDFKKAGVDKILVIAFNDAWVMNAWRRENGVKNDYTVCRIEVLYRFVLQLTLDSSLSPTHPPRLPSKSAGQRASELDASLSSSTTTRSCMRRMNPAANSQFPLRNQCWNSSRMPNHVLSVA
jgi:hypothetical protein